MPDDTASFLTKILPETGVYQLFVKDTRQHLIFSDPFTMASKALSLDAKGMEVYHACASYFNGGNRTADNVAAVKCIWFDVDCGQDKAESGKGYETKLKGLIAIRAFCKLLYLPKPMIVDSGSGFHIYWPFVSAISPVEWKTTTTKLKALYHAPDCRLLADNSRTTDIASILRPVGTHNRKTSPPKRVELLIDVAPIAFKVFSQAVEAAYQRFVSGSRMVHSPGTAIRSVVVVRAQANPDCYTLNDVEAALSLISPWCSRPDWIKVGFALADAFGEDARGLFLRWSRGDLEGAAK
jgi:hypothetical protein